MSGASAIYRPRPLTTRQPLTFALSPTRRSRGEEGSPTRARWRRRGLEEEHTEGWWLVRPPRAAGDPHLHSGPGLPPSLPPAAERVSGSAPPVRACGSLSSGSSVCSAAGRAPRSPAPEPEQRGASRQFPAGNRPTLTSGPDAGWGREGVGPRVDGVDASLAARPSLASRLAVEGRWGRRREKREVGARHLLQCPPGVGASGAPRLRSGQLSPGLEGRPQQASSPGGSRGDPRPGGEPRL